MSLYCCSFRPGFSLLRMGSSLSSYAAYAALSRLFSQQSHVTELTGPAGPFNHTPSPHQYTAHTHEGHIGEMVVIIVRGSPTHLPCACQNKAQKGGRTITKDTCHPQKSIAMCAATVMASQGTGIGATCSDSRRGQESKPDSKSSLKF